MQKQGDRFIPHRGAMDLDLSHYHLTKENSFPQEEVSAVEYQSSLSDAVFEGREKSKILAFKAKAPVPALQSNMQVLYSTNKQCTGKPKATRHIPQQAEKVLDAPDMVDDYYLNLLDWSPNNILAVALGQSVYLWNATTGSCDKLFTAPEADNIVTSVSWIQEGSVLAVGTNMADVQLWDCDAQRMVRNMKGHTGRVGSLAWNQHILSSGSRDSSIFNHDVRLGAHHVSTLAGHTQEVCGLRWSPDGTQLASGGNDNLLNIWDSGATTARFTLDQHQAAVKAIAWCPWQASTLATGGGTADRCIRFWNTSSGACLNTVDTKSQVCALLWSAPHRELVSSHGYSQNQICVWKYPTMTKQAELMGHSSRVLHMAMSPDGQTVVSGAGDETLRFWKVFASETKTAGAKRADAGNSALLRSLR
jgi:cell division cycle protein 20 (cofactor of APC complex)